MNDLYHVDPYSERFLDTQHFNNASFYDVLYLLGRFRDTDIEACVLAGARKKYVSP